MQHYLPKALYHKLEEFVFKYYLNEFVRGVFWCVGWGIIAFLGMVVLESGLFEYNFSLPAFRKLLVLGWCFGACILVIKNILWPCIQYFRWNKQLHHRQAATIIGKHFPEIKDKLLNTLQLAQQNTNAALLQASIEKRIQLLRPIPFVKAIQFKQSKQIAGYALGIVALFLGLLWTSSFIQEGSYRITNYNKIFTPPAPFSFEISTNSFALPAGEDFNLKLAVTGLKIPKEVFIIRDGFRYKTKALGFGEFAFTFKNLQEDATFYLEAAGVQSSIYTISVIPKAHIESFIVQLDYPTYLRRKSEKIINQGNLIVPKGTKVTWHLQTKNAQNLLWSTPSERVKVPVINNKTLFSKKVLKSSSYQWISTNKELGVADSSQFYIQTIPDKKPVLSTQVFKDSLENNLLYIVGETSDDYGLRRMELVLKMHREDSLIKDSIITLPINQKRYAFISTSIDIPRLNLPLGTQLEYFIRVWDNDGVSGSKYTQSPVYTYYVPTLLVLEETKNTHEKRIRQQLQYTLHQQNQAHQELNTIIEALLQKSEVGWETRHQINGLVANGMGIWDTLATIQPHKMLEYFGQDQPFSDDFYEFMENWESEIAGWDVLANQLDTMQQWDREQLLEMLRTLEKEQTAISKMVETLNQHVLEKNEAPTIEYVAKEPDFSTNDSSHISGNDSATIQKYPKWYLQGLEDLLYCSKTQEDLLEAFQQVYPNDPGYRRLTREQYNLNYNFDKTRVKIESKLNRYLEHTQQPLGEIWEMFLLFEAVEDHQDIAIKHLERGDRRLATTAQQQCLDKNNQLLAKFMEGGSLEKKGTCETTVIDPLGESKPHLNEKKEVIEKQQLAEELKRQQQLSRQLEQLLQGQGRDSLLQQQLNENMDSIEMALLQEQWPSQQILRQNLLIQNWLERENADYEQTEKGHKRIVEQPKTQKQGDNRPAALDKYLQQQKQRTVYFYPNTAILKPTYQRKVEQYWDSLR